MTAALAAVLVATTTSCSHKIAITAHRGYWNCDEAGHAENSLKALELAQREGFWGSEYDVHMTSDFVLVVHHDHEANGVNIQTHKYSDFDGYRLKNGEKMPTLEEYLTQAEKSGTVLVFELKSQLDKAHEDYMVDRCVEALKNHGLYDPNKVIFLSGSLNICQRLCAMCPGFTAQFLNGDLSPEELVANGVNGIDYNSSVYHKHPEWVKQAHKQGMKVNVWTVDSEDEIKEMIGLGVDCITTNNPLLVRSILKGREKR